MGILADIFVTSEQNALGYESRQLAGNLGNMYERVEFKGLTDLEFGTLWAILEGEKWNLKKHGLEQVTPPGESWLFRFPSSFVQSLTNLTSEDIDKIAGPWAQTEELRCDPSKIKPILMELVRLAKLATSSSQRLYLWGSL